MKRKGFKALNGSELIVCHRRSAVIFELPESSQDTKYDFRFEFDPTTFKELLEYIEEAANNSWKNITPREADSLNSDYWEYYDRQLMPMGT